MPLSFLDTINFLSLSLGAFIPMILVYILLNKGKWQILSNRLLSIYLLGMGMVCFMTLILKTTIIYEIPWLYRLPSPLYYIMLPSGYLYVKTLLNDKNKLTPFDYLHFIPGCIHFLEMLPYYLKSNDYKLMHLTQNLQDPLGPFMHNEGWLPSYIHNCIRGALGILYAILIIYQLLHFRKNQPILNKKYPTLTKWLWLFGIMLLIWGITLLYTLINGDKWDNPSYQAILMTICYSGTQIITGIVLLLYPSYLYGMPRNTLDKPFVAGTSELLPFNEASVVTLKNEAVNIESLLPKKEADNKQHENEIEAFYYACKEKLDAFMQKEKPFLQQNYKVADLSKDLGIPQHHLTILLNKFMNMRFNDYINLQRIQYISEIIEKQGLSHSLEGFAMNAGFSNRITFTRAVQKLTGQNPSIYFQIGSKVAHT